MRKTALLIFFLLLGSVLWAQSKYALIIGNANYPRAEDRLANAVNDTNDISAALRELGFNVELKQNLRRLDMVREISAFITRLGNDRSSEGFLWYAGHAMEINSEIFLFPLDVNIDNDEPIRATSFSVNDLTRQFEGVRNKVNVVVLDACRVPPSDSRSRGGDTTRVIRTVPLTPSDLFVMYSTAPGTVALDGTGKRNSPFAEAFLKNIKSAEPLTIMAGHVTSDTMTLTGNRQRPYTSGNMGRDNVYYSLNPSGVRPNPQAIYKIGDTGPAGGIIFYDKGIYSDSWRYLEAAPVETEFSAKWSTNEIVITGTGTAVGSGKRNTQLIVERLSRLRETETAAQLCVNLNFGGFTDWFLPSLDELALMFQNLARKGVGGFGLGNDYYGADRYWSSSQYRHPNPEWVQFMYISGHPAAAAHWVPYHVRAVRAF